MRLIESDDSAARSLFEVVKYMLRLKLILGKSWPDAVVDFRKLPDDVRRILVLEGQAFIARARTDLRVDRVRIAIWMGEFNLGRVPVDFLEVRALDLAATKPFVPSAHEVGYQLCKSILDMTNDPPKLAPDKRDEELAFLRGCVQGLEKSIGVLQAQAAKKP